MNDSTVLQVGNQLRKLPQLIKKINDQVSDVC